MQMGLDARDDESQEGSARAAAPPGELVDALRGAGREIRHPAARLHFVRASLDRYHVVERAETVLPSPAARRLILAVSGLEGLRRAVLFWERRSTGVRRAAWLAVLLGAALAAFLGVRWLRPAPEALAAAPAAAPAAGLPAVMLPPSDPVTEPAPAAPAGLSPTRVWRVEAGPGFELYSNGLRIELEYSTTHQPRRYRAFSWLAQGLVGEEQSRPAGILYHTSESDVWPMDEAHNENLRESSHNLLRYIHRLRLYNYVIDRFGRVYRVVDEEHKANHAGNSVWQDGDRVYLSLNHSFLGICFETRWEGGRVLPITAAQLSAGRLLTDHLRQRWQISPEMCVAHGLASVNPKKRLIGHHVDWARGFPFEAFGLPDQYAVPAPAVTLFGFGYDDDFVKVMGEPWPGVRLAEAALAEEAGRRGLTLDALRIEKQQLYDAWSQAQAREEGRAAGAATGSGGDPSGVRGRGHSVAPASEARAPGRSPGASRPSRGAGASTDKPSTASGG